MVDKLVLASASPRRKQLLEQIGVLFSTNIADIDETPWQGESPRHYVKRLALEKANTVYDKLKQADSSVKANKLWVLGSDTSVIVDKTILGKPENKEHGLQMLAKLSGRQHRVLTSVALVGEVKHCIISESDVTFAKISPQQIDAYWETGEPADKAGGYAIQGKAAVFIEHIQGSFSGVMGLPLFETAELLRLEGLLPKIG